MEITIANYLLILILTITPVHITSHWFTREIQDVVYQRSNKKVITFD